MTVSGPAENSSRGSIAVVQYKHDASSIYARETHRRYQDVRPLGMRESNIEFQQQLLPPRLSRHRGPLIYYFQCRMHPAFVPLLCHHNQDANRGALVVEYTSLMV